MKDDTRINEHISDLLRQRRGRRHAGADLGSAKPRDPNTVERYLQ
jgi:hypothetical protein